MGNPNNRTPRGGKSSTVTRITSARNQLSPPPAQNTAASASALPIRGSSASTNQPQGPASQTDRTRHAAHVAIDLEIRRTTWYSSPATASTTPIRGNSASSRAQQITAASGFRDLTRGNSASSNQQPDERRRGQASFPALSTPDLSESGATEADPFGPIGPPFMTDIQFEVPFSPDWTPYLKSKVYDDQGNDVFPTITIHLHHDVVTEHCISRAPAVKRFLILFYVGAPMLSEPQTHNFKACLNLRLPLLNPDVLFGVKCFFEAGLEELSNHSPDDLRDASNILLMTFTNLGLENGYDAVMTRDDRDEWRENGNGTLTIVRFVRREKGSDL